MIYGLVSIPNIPFFALSAFIAKRKGLSEEELEDFLNRNEIEFSIVFFVTAILFYAFIGICIYRCLI